MPLVSAAAVNLDLPLPMTKLEFPFSTATAMVLELELAMATMTLNLYFAVPPSILDLDFPMITPLAMAAVIKKSKFTTMPPVA